MTERESQCDKTVKESFCLQSSQILHSLLNPSVNEMNYLFFRHPHTFCSSLPDGSQRHCVMLQYESRYETRALKGITGLKKKDTLKICCSRMKMLNVLTLRPH